MSNEKPAFDHIGAAPTIEQDYMRQALETENQDFATIAERIREHLPTILAHMGVIMTITTELDAIKRKVIYGSSDEKLAEKGVSMPVYMNLSDLPEGAENLIDEGMVRLMHGVIGKGTEVGELFEALYNHLTTGEDLDVTNISEEMGDDAWYNQLILSVCGLRQSEVCNQNLAKLKGVRYKSGYSDEAALDRDKETERETLETS